MATKTESSDRVTREELSTYLRQLADEFENGEDVDVPVGNKRINLSPSDEVTREIEVVERSSKLRGNREEIDLSVRWKVK